jgi:phage gpG-like protein
MITARLVGDDAVLAWLRATPDLAASGLARAITTLGIELLRKIQEGDPTGQTLAGRSGPLGSGLQLDQSDNRIAATVSSSSEYAHTHGYGAVGVGAKLRHITKAFGRPSARKAINVRPDRRRIDVPKSSFLSSALEDMDPAIRDEVEAALREALTR